MPAKPVKNRRSVATGAKLLIAAAALGGTLGAWATLSIVQDQTADADAPTAIVVDAPPDPWADFAAALPPVPTVAAFQRRPLVFIESTPPPIPDAPQLDTKPVEAPQVAAAAPAKPAAPAAPARPAQQPAAPVRPVQQQPAAPPPPPPAPTLRVVEAPPPPPVVADVPAAQAAVSSASKKSASPSAPDQPPAPKPVTKTRSSK